jgi:hypothetical protein
MVEAIAEQGQKPLSINASFSPLSVEELFYGQSDSVASDNLDGHRESSDDLLTFARFERGACKLGRDHRG